MGAKSQLFRFHRAPWLRLGAVRSVESENDRDVRRVRFGIRDLDTRPRNAQRLSDDRASVAFAASINDRGMRVVARIGLGDRADFVALRLEILRRRRG